jgi:flavorubredoxin
MFSPIPLTGNVFWIGVNDRETQLFEAMWPLPNGVSYNSYLIVDEKIALIDTVKKPFLTDLLAKIRDVIGPQRHLDYVIINHMEPDHSGALEIISQFFPNLQIIGNKWTKDFLAGYYGITDNVKVINDGDGLSLGKHTLTFHFTPMVHWPETLMTFDETSKILFSGDAFGGFGALDGGIFDDEVDIAFYENETLRYFSNIIGKFSPMVQKAIDKVKHLEIRTIASTHGPIWRSNPQHILESYDRWSRHETSPGAVIAYGSMYANTQKMAEAVARALAEGGIREIRIHNVSRSHLSYMLTDAWRFNGLILGSCTYEAALFPPMKHLVDTLEEKAMAKNRALGLFGSYGWSGGAVKQLREFAQRGNWQVIEPVVEAKGAPSAEALTQCALLGRNMAKELNSKEARSQS